MRWSVAPVLAVVALALGGLAVAQTDRARDALADVGLSPPSEPYTEIAFEDPDALPTSVSGAEVGVSFWVRNMEGAARGYRWTATTRAPGGAPRRAASGRLSLADGDSTTIAARIPVTCAGPRTRINVSLGGENRAIGFWLDCAGGSR